MKCIGGSSSPHVLLVHPSYCAVASSTISTSLGHQLSQISGQKSFVIPLVIYRRSGVSSCCAQSLTVTQRHHTRLQRNLARANRCKGIHIGQGIDRDCTHLHSLLAVPEYLRCRRMQLPRTRRLGLDVVDSGALVCRKLVKNCHGCQQHS